MLMHLAAYMHVYFVACNNMRSVLPHAYLVGLEALDLFFLSEPPQHALPFFMCARTRQWIRCVFEQRMPWWDCAFAQARLSCLFSHSIIACLINWHVFQIVFAISYLKKKRFRAWRRSWFLLDFKVYFTLKEAKKYWRLIKCKWKH